MAFITADIKIPELMQQLTCRLYYPTDLPDAVGNTVKGVITLLHGMSNTSCDWMMMSAACRYAADNGYILVAPDGGNSFFLDMAYGPPWYTILTELLPVQLNRIFHIPAERGKNYIAGLSMGGYGAMLIGLRHPERYAAVGSFSGAMDLGGMAARAAPFPLARRMFAPVLGDGLTLPEEWDLLPLARRVAALPKDRQPRLLCTCGAQDNDETMIRTQNRSFCAQVQNLALDYTYLEWNGPHEWSFWDRSLAEFIGFIQSSDYAGRKRRDWAREACAGAAEL